MIFNGDFNNKEMTTIVKEEKIREEVKEYEDGDFYE